MEAIKFEYMDESVVGEHLKCTCCQHPLIDPVLNQCKHQFCAKCAENESKNDRSCPKCGESIRHLTPITESTLLNELNSVPVKCKKCGKENILRNTFVEHVEIHRLEELCTQQKETIRKLKIRSGNSTGQWKLRLNNHRDIFNSL